MSTSLQTPPPDTRPSRPVRARVAVAGLAVFVAAALTGVLVARANTDPSVPTGGAPGDTPGTSLPSAGPTEQAAAGGQPAGEPGRAGNRPAAPGRPAAAAFPYQPLWPFAGPADAAAWQRGYRTGGHQPWHLDPNATALAFSSGYLGYTDIDKVVRSSISGREANVAVGFRLPDGALHTAAVVHLARLGAGNDAPWEVVGTRDTSLTLATPAYGARVTSPLTVGGRITGVDESLSVHVHALGRETPVGLVDGITPGGPGTRWSARVPFQARHGAVLTVAVATGGHVTTVERFAVTAVHALVRSGARDGDVDGDGRVDAVSFPALGTLRIRYAAGSTDTVRFEASGQPGVKLLGIVDADRDGRAEVFVRTGGSASADFATVFRYVNGRLRLVTLDGSQARLGSGGSVRHAESWGCGSPGKVIFRWSGESDDGVVYRGTVHSYGFQGTALRLTGSGPLTVTPDQPAPTGCGSVRTS